MCRPIYLCGEVEGSDDTRVMVPLVCKENWEEFINCLPDDDGFVVRLEVKKLTAIKSNPWGVFVIVFVLW